MFGQPDLLHATNLLYKWQREVRTTTLGYLLKVADMFDRHFMGVANALCNKASNAIAERINGAIQELKSIAKGFRKPENFRSHFVPLRKIRSISTTIFPVEPKKLKRWTD